MSDTVHTWSLSSISSMLAAAEINQVLGDMTEVIQSRYLLAVLSCFLLVIAEYDNHNSILKCAVQNLMAGL